MLTASSTSSPSPVAVTAGLATLKRVLAPGFFESLSRTTRAVVDGLVEEARRAIQTAESKIIFARTAVEASESVRAIRTARHREGLRAS